MYCQTSRSDQSASGFAFHSPCRRSQSTFLASRREDECSRRSPATQQSTSDSARFSGVTLRMPQHLSGSRAHSASPNSAACCSSDRPRYTSIEMSYLSSSARQVVYVSSNRRSVSSVKKRADGSIRSSMSMITDASFWNEQATYRRGWKRSTRYSRTDSAVSPSKSGGRSIGGAWRLMSNRALALATHDLVRLVALPVDEVLHVLEVEFDRQREILRARLELGHADPLHERVELLALVPLGLVVAQPALDRLGHALRGKPHLEPRAHHHVAAVVVAGEVADVGGQVPVADLHRRAVEADIRDVVLRAPVRATAVLDVDLARERILDVHLDQLVVDRPVEAHRGRDAELARVGAGAAHVVGDLVGARVAEVELDKPLPHVVQRLVAHPAQHEVLVHGRARPATAELAHDLGQAAELLRREVAAEHLDLDRREAGLALRRHVRGDEVVE